VRRPHGVRGVCGGAGNGRSVRRHDGRAGRVSESGEAVRCPRRPGSLTRTGEADRTIADRIPSRKPAVRGRTSPAGLEPPGSGRPRHPRPGSDPPGADAVRGGRSMPCRTSPRSPDSAAVGGRPDRAQRGPRACRATHERPHPYHHRFRSPRARRPPRPPRPRRDPCGRGGKALMSIRPWSRASSSSSPSRRAPLVERLEERRLLTRLIGGDTFLLPQRPGRGDPRRARRQHRGRTRRVRRRVQQRRDPPQPCGAGASSATSAAAGRRS
jgi:hypothetical protein